MGVVDSRVLIADASAGVCAFCGLSTHLVCSDCGTHVCASCERTYGCPICPLGEEGEEIEYEDVRDTCMGCHRHTVEVCFSCGSPLCWMCDDRFGCPVCQQEDRK